MWRFLIGVEVLAIGLSILIGHESDFTVKFSWKLMVLSANIITTMQSVYVVLVVLGIYKSIDL
jgi:hypothetical protein